MTKAAALAPNAKVIRLFPLNARNTANTNAAMPPSSVSVLLKIAGKVIVVRQA